MNLKSIIKGCVIFLVAIFSVSIILSQVYQKVIIFGSAKSELEISKIQDLNLVKQLIEQSQQKYDNWSEYEKVRERIRELRLSKDLYGLVRLQDEVEATWGKTQPIDVFGRNLYAGLMYDICSGISSYNFDNNEQYVLSRKCVKQALGKRDNMPIWQEVDLVNLLGGTNEYLLELVPEEKWVSDRKERVEYWGHAWQRLKGEVIENYDLTNRPVNKSNPTLEEKEKIKTFAKQYKLHQVKASFSKLFKNFLTEVYTKPPYNTLELKENLKKYVTDAELKNSILVEVEQKIVEQNSQDK